MAYILVQFSSLLRYKSEAYIFHKRTATELSSLQLHYKPIKVAQGTRKKFLIIMEMQMPKDMRRAWGTNDNEDKQQWQQQLPLAATMIMLLAVDDNNI